MDYAKGRVITGFSYPVVGKYAASGGKVSFSGGMVLARGVGVDVSVSTASDNEFYADDVLAESETDVFESGSVKLTVDGLFDTARRFISGESEAESETFGAKQINITKYGTKNEKPYIGVGVIVQYKSGGKTLWQPYVFQKTKFKDAGLKANTMGKTISWQTEELEATIHRADTEDAEWKWACDDCASESAAKEALNAIFGIAAEA